METDEDFIPGIFNYCDNWCSACPFTSRCRGFAMEAELEAHLDPNLRALAEQHRECEERKIPAWIETIVEAAERAVERGEIEDAEPKPSADAHKPLEWRAQAYSDNVHRWLDEQKVGRSDDPGDPLAVVAWFPVYILSKVRRATVGLANDDGELSECPSDSDGSAKAALIAVQRSRAAWGELVAAEMVARDVGLRLMAELSWLEAEIDRVFPNARGFVRPGFDEPRSPSDAKAP